jgi:hypothetical protein
MVCRLLSFFFSFLLSFSEASRSSSVPSHAGPTTPESVFSVEVCFSFFSLVPADRPPSLNRYLHGDPLSLASVSGAWSPARRALSLANTKGEAVSRRPRPFVASPSRRIALALAFALLSRRPNPLVASPLPPPRPIALALRRPFITPPCRVPLSRCFRHPWPSSGRAAMAPRVPTSRRSNDCAGGCGASLRRLGPRSVHTKGRFHGSGASVGPRVHNVHT